MVNMRDFCECVYAPMSQLTQMGTLSLMRAVSSGIAPAEGRQLTHKRLPHWPESQKLSACGLALETATGQGSEGWLQKLRVASSQQSTGLDPADSLIALLILSRELGQAVLTRNQYSEIIKVLFQGTKFKVLCYAQVVNECRLFYLLKEEVHTIALTCTYSPVAP